jgi:hypothetical protein
MLKINVELRAPEIAIGEGFARQLHIPGYFTFEERQLLRAMRGIVGRIQIDGDAMSAMVQPLGVAPDYAAGQELAQPIQLLDPNPVLETRQRRLRSQIATLNRIALQEQFVNRITGQAGRVVSVR